MPWRSIRGHDRIVEDLRLVMAQGRFPHAFLFVGPEGIGKRGFALTLAQALLCERHPVDALDPCGECPGCRQVEAQTHPDLHLAARPEEKHELPIAVIRALCDEMALKPMRGPRKVAIVDDADALNEEAANAFLKTLEEPSEGSVLILVGTSAELQLDTILSRCRVVRFDSLPEPELAAVLLESGIAAGKTEAHRLAKLGEGSVARARGLADADLESFRRSMIDEITSAGGFDPSALARRLEAFVKEAGKESLAQRLRASLLVSELARFFRGVLWQTAGLESPAPDLADRLAAATVAERLEPEDVFLLADRCLEADYHIRRMAYLPVALDALTSDLGRFLQPRR
ncbi:DNA polymerase III subunit delta' [soil metagenome]